jgi:hypothetical protein
MIHNTFRTMQIVLGDIDRQLAQYCVNDSREAESVYEFHKSATGIHPRSLL